MLIYLKQYIVTLLHLLTMGPKRSTRNALPLILAEHDLNNNNFFPDRDLSKLSEDSRMLVEIIMDKFDNFSQEISAKLEIKNEKIADLEREVVTLRKQNNDLYDRLDSIETNERNDSVIISGSVLPPGQKEENTAFLAKSLIVDKLRINLSEQDIKSAHPREETDDPTG